MTGMSPILRGPAKIVAMSPQKRISMKRPYTVLKKKGNVKLGRSVQSPGSLHTNAFVKLL